jgi:hypothetical protein
MPAYRELGYYLENEFFAYVEDSEQLAAEWMEPPQDSWWYRLFAARRSLDLPRPNRLFWLDCVAARYFSGLEWRDDPCEIGDVGAMLIRRARIRSLASNQFVIAPLLLGEDRWESSLAKQFAAGGRWHRIVLDDSGKGTPVLTSEDYDFDAASILKFLRYESECSEDEERSLRNVFSLNFLPDGGLDGGGRSEPEPPPKASPDIFARLRARHGLGKS